MALSYLASFQSWIHWQRSCKASFPGLYTQLLHCQDCSTLTPRCASSYAYNKRYSNNELGVETLLVHPVVYKIFQKINSVARH